MKIVFMGTPDFSVGILAAIIAAGHEVSAVVTQPDKAKGRGKEVQMPAVKICALEHDIAVFQPKRIKTEESVNTLRNFEADIFVVAAFGQILSREILNMPKFGCVNVHASLLPKYRGAAPIQWAIINGETETGITIMQMNEGLDTGDILLQSKVSIEPFETGESLHDKLSVIGAELIVESLPLIEAGSIESVFQKDEAASYAKILKKDMGHIRFQQSAVEIERLVRGLNSWPSAYTYLNGKTLKIWKAAAIESKENGLPGTVAEINKEWIRINTGNGLLEITELQLEGKKRMSVGDFLLGYRLSEMDSLES